MKRRCYYCEKLKPDSEFPERYKCCLACWPYVFNKPSAFSGIEFPQFTYITDADPPRTLVESFIDAERRRRELEERVANHWRNVDA